MVTLPSVSTIADGTAVKTPGEKIFPYVSQNLDDIITVEDDELIVAFLDMVENHKMIVENSGLLTVAALKHLNVKGKRVVSILSGGQHGCDHHVLRGAERTDFPRPDLYRLRTAAGQAGRAVPRLRHCGSPAGQCDQVRAQPVRILQPQRGRGAADHHGGFRHRTQEPDHPRPERRGIRCEVGAGHAVKSRDRMAEKLERTGMIC